jgi:hypothetical protein
MDKNHVQFRFLLPRSPERLADYQLLINCHDFRDTNGRAVDVTALAPGVHTLFARGLPLSAVEKFLAVGRHAHCAVAVHANHYDGWKPSEHGFISFYSPETRRSVRNFAAGRTPFSPYEPRSKEWPNLLMLPSKALPDCLKDPLTTG